MKWTDVDGVAVLAEHKGVPVKATIEHMRDGSSCRWVRRVLVALCWWREGLVQFGREEGAREEWGRFSRHPVLPLCHREERVGLTGWLVGLLARRAFH